MGEAANKALMFGVGIFITVIIISGIMFIFSQMQEIYKQVGTTDTTITSRFGKYSSYDNTKVTGLEVINCANKYYKENLVVVTYNGFEVNTDSGLNYLDEQYASLLEHLGNQKMILSSSDEGKIIIRLFKN